MHEPCALSSLLVLCFFLPAVLINFRFVQVLLSLPPAAVAVAGCRSCSCVWHAFNAGLRQPTSALAGGRGRPREIGMLQHLCQCQHCQYVRVCHFARCIACCCFFWLFFRLLNGAEIAKSFKKTVCNVLDSLPACQDYQMDVKVDQIARISNEINVSCITLPTFERVKEFLSFSLLSCISLPAFEWLLKTPAAAAANRSANSRHIHDTAFAGNFLLMTYAHISLHVASLLSLLMPCGKAGCGCPDSPPPILIVPAPVEKT